MQPRSSRIVSTHTYVCTTLYKCTCMKHYIVSCRVRASYVCILDMATISTCVFVALLSVLSVTGTEKDCPPWSKWYNGTAQCVCSDAMVPAIMCDQREQRSSLGLGFCAFQDSTTNGTVVAACPYVFPDHLIVDERIPLPIQ